MQATADCRTATCEAPQRHRLAGQIGVYIYGRLWELLRIASRAHTRFGFMSFLPKGRAKYFMKCQTRQTRDTLPKYFELMMFWKIKLFHEMRQVFALLIVYPMMFNDQGPLFYRHNGHWLTFMFILKLLRPRSVKQK